MSRVFAAAPDSCAANQGGTCKKQAGWVLAAAVLLFILGVSGPAAAQTITEDTIWTSADSPVHTTGITVADGFTLTIESGVEVRFADNGRLLVQSGGALVTAGSEAEPVIFTHDSDTPTSGGWIGIVVAQSGTLELSHAIVEYGGASHDPWQESGIISTSSHDTTLENCVLRYSYQDGIVTVENNSADFPAMMELSNVEISDCPRYGIQFQGFNHPTQSILSEVNIHDSGDSAIRFPGFDRNPIITSPTFANNGFDGIDVVASNNETRDYTIGGNTTWRVPYIRTPNGITGRIEEGARVLINGQLYNYDLFIETGGTLVVEGTENNPVVFTSDDENLTPGSMRESMFQRSSTIRLSHCRFEYGNTIYVVTSDFEARNVTIDHSAGRGLYYSPDTREPWSRALMIDLTINNCAAEPLILPSYMIWTPVLQGLSMSGNLHDWISLEGVSYLSMPTGIDITIEDPGYPFYTTYGISLYSENTITFGPGLEVILRGGTTVHNGLLRAIGTAENPVKFLDSEFDAGIPSTLNVNNGGRVEFSHCIVEGFVSISGGPTYGYSAFDADNCIFRNTTGSYGVHVDSGARTSFANCEFTGHDYSALSLQGYVADFDAVVENCVFHDNGDVGLDLYGPARAYNCDFYDNAGIGIRAYAFVGDEFPSVIEGCRFSGNGTYAVQNASTYQPTPLPARNCWWGDPSGPYHASLNPDGLGDPVSNNVAFVPWATSPDEAGSSEVQPFGLDSPTSATTAGTDYYVLTLQSGDVENLLIRLTPNSGDGTWILTERDGEQPTPAFYDRRGHERDGGWNIVIPSPPTGIYYIAVEYNSPSGSGSYQLQATDERYYLESVETEAAGNAGEFTQELTGAGFTSGMSVELRDGSRAVLGTFTPSSYTATKLVVPMDLTGLPVGTADVVAVWPDATERILSAAFEITQGLGAEFSASFQHQTWSFRAGRPQIASLTYQNTGDADADARILVISATVDDATLRTSLLEEAGTDNLQILSIGPSNNAGSMPPEFRKTIDVYFQRQLNESFQLVLEQKLADSSVIDWDSQKDTLRPEVIDTATWDAAWPTLKSRLGATTADHIDMLKDAAQRISNRGTASPDPAYSVSHLIDLEARLAAGAPAAAISGRLLLLPYGRPQPSAAVKLYDIADPDSAPLVARSNSNGEFCFSNLPDGDYDLYVNGYFLDSPVMLTISGQIDVQAGDIPIYDTDPTIQGPDNVLLGRSPSLTSGGSGKAMLVWDNGGELYSLAWQNSTWQGSAALADTVGSAPHVVYDANLFGAGQDGMLAVWEEMDANGVNTLVWSAGDWDGTAFQWTVPQALTSDANDDLAPRLTLAPDGTWRVIWMQRANGTADDTDLYMAAVDPSSAGDWYTPPIILENPARDTCDSLNFATKIEIPQRLQEVFGKSYAAEVGFELCEGPKTCGEYKKSGGANIAIELGDSLKANGSGTIEASYRLSCKPCRYMPWTMKMTATGGLETEFARPLPIIVGGVPVGKATFSIPVAVQMKGALYWNHEFTGLPDTGYIGIDCIAGGRVVIEDNLGVGKGQGDLNITGSYQWNPNEGFKVDGACVTLSGEAAIFGGFAKRKISKQWGDACRRGLPDFREDRWVTDKVMHYSRTYIDGDLVVTESLETVAEPLTGTGGTYEGTPVLSTIASDLYDDGQPSALRNGTAGESLMIWTKDVGDYANGLGNQVVFSVDDGTGWSAPSPIQTERQFNRDPQMIFDASGNLFAVWSQASATGLDSNSPIATVDATAQQSHIVFSRRIADVWSTPIAIDTLPGRNEQPAILRIGSKIFAVWVQVVSDTQSNIVSSTWTGSFWSTPTVVSTSAWCDGPTMAAVDTMALLVWSEDEDGDLDTPADTRLRYATTGSGTWAGVSYIPATLTSEVSNTTTAKVLTRADIARVERAIPRPDDVCCGDSCKPTYKKPRPRKPPEPRDEVDRTRMNEIQPTDPNEKQAPLGWGVYHIVERDDELVYTILFENKPEATAPAQEVFITDDLAADIDWTTFRVQELGWGDQQMSFPERPAAINEYVSIADYRADVGAEWLVNIRGSVDDTSGRVDFTFRTLDPETEELPLDTLAGFLPPNDETHRGEGYIVFSVKPKDTTATDLSVTIRNIATIIFDLEDPIVTNEVGNAIGDIPALWSEVLSDVLAIDDGNEPTDINGDGAIDVGDMMGR
ncbi:right-handed parallel beta-helix repeat-containing protein [bacterium]|nr:right-handed parallel beta-helix repeat-containing protein [bacterium]